MLERAETQTTERQAQQTANPVEEMSHILDTDMRAVNTIILERMGSDVPLIQQLAAYIISAGGKRIRPLLTLASTQIFNGDMNRARNLAACVEFIHTATLLHDDVVDESDERRGKATANTIFGNQASVLVGDFLFSRAFQMMVDDKSLEVLRILSDASAIIAEGEVMQLMTAGNIETTMDEYLKVIQSKTAALFSAATEIGPVTAEKDKATIKAMADYGTHLGMAFQIIDDILDYSEKNEALGKNIGDDFKEGKITAPILHCLSAADDQEKEFWYRVLVDKNQTDSDLKHAMEIMKKHGAIEKSKKMAENYAQQAKDALNAAPPSAMRDLLCSLISFTVDRHY